MNYSITNLRWLSKLAGWLPASALPAALAETTELTEFLTALRPSTLRADL